MLTGEEVSGSVLNEVLERGPRTDTSTSSVSSCGARGPWEGQRGSGKETAGRPRSLVIVQATCALKHSPGHPEPATPQPGTFFPWVLLSIMEWGRWGSGGQDLPFQDPPSIRTIQGRAGRAWPAWLSG